MHACRKKRMREPSDPDQVLFRPCTRPASSGTPMTGRAVNEVIRCRAAQAGFTPAQIALLGAHSLWAGFECERPGGSAT